MCQIWSCISYNDNGVVIYSKIMLNTARRMGGIDVGIAWRNEIHYIKRVTYY